MSTESSSEDEGGNEAAARPEVTDYDSYEEFYAAVYQYLLDREDVEQFTSAEHIQNGNELVRMCPHCEAPSIISLMSNVGSPSWRCVGQTGLSDRHHFTRRNIPDERLNVSTTNPISEKYMGDDANVENLLTGGDEEEEGEAAE